MKRKQIKVLLYATLRHLSLKLRKVSVAKDSVYLLAPHCIYTLTHSSWKILTMSYARVQYCWVSVRDLGRKFNTLDERCHFQEVFFRRIILRAEPLDSSHRVPRKWILLIVKHFRKLVRNIFCNFFGNRFVPLEYYKLCLQNVAEHSRFVQI